MERETKPDPAIQFPEWWEVLPERRKESFRITVRWYPSSCGRGRTVASLDDDCIREFLSGLARGNCSASTQKPALNPIVFLTREVFAAAVVVENRAGGLRCVGL
jgi:hypothetical protein